jgi:glycosyltransferase involved in cell wall biosynthesis
MIKKVDIVMWTKNGEYCLTEVLARIDKVIPGEIIHRRILVDDKSTDQTVAIARKFNWTVYTNPHGGIPSGANEALRHVDCDFFLSFEQDILLSDDWWNRISKYMEDFSVASAQGIRIPSQPILNLLDRWEFAEQGKPRLLVSIDNNIFRTEVVRQMGGFPKDCPVCTDTILRKRLLKETPYKWIIDNNVVSLHVRKSLKNSIVHSYKLYNICVGTPYCSTKEEYTRLTLLRMLLTSPIRGIQIAFEKNYPVLVFAYPYLRFHQLISDLKYKTLHPKITKQ